MKEIDPKLGVPLPERSYANNCVIYDDAKPSDPWHNVKVFTLFYFSWARIWIGQAIDLKLWIKPAFIIDIYDTYILNNTL